MQLKEKCDVLDKAGYKHGTTDQMSVQHFVTKAKTLVEQMRRRK